MPIKIIRGKQLPIGVDLGSSSVKLAQLRLSEDAAELTASGAGSVPAPDPKDRHARLESVSEAIREVLKDRPFKGEQAVLSLPAEETIVQHIKIAKVPADQTESAVLAELQGKLPYSVDEAVVRHVVAGDIYVEGNPKQEVIAIAAPRRTLEAYVDMARRAKLDVVSVNVEPCAIVECFSRLFRRASDTSRAILYIDLGAKTTQAVLSHGSRIVFARNLTIGGERLDRAVAEAMNVPVAQAHALREDLLTGLLGDQEQEGLYRMLDAPLDALAGEITKCLRYYESVFRNQNVERAIFVGGQAADRRLCQAVAQRLNLPAQVGDPLIRIGGAAVPGGDGDRREPQPRWAVAVGLSLGAARAA
jgi:type IV pilus assembly protein PilM